MYNSKSEKEYFIDLFINDFKTFLYYDLAEDVLDLHLYETNLSTGIDIVIKLILDRLSYEATKPSDEEMMKMKEEAESRNPEATCVFITTDLYEIISDEWFDFKNNLKYSGFNSRLVLRNLYNFFPRKEKDIGQEEIDKYTSILRDRVSEFMDKWFFDKDILNNAKMAEIKKRISKKENQN